MKNTFSTKRKKSKQLSANSDITLLQHDYQSTIFPAKDTSVSLQVDILEWSNGEIGSSCCTAAVMLCNVENKRKGPTPEPPLPGADTLLNK